MRGRGSSGRVAAQREDFRRVARHREEAIRRSTRIALESRRACEPRTHAVSLASRPNADTNEPCPDRETGALRRREALRSEGHALL